MIYVASIISFIFGFVLAAMFDVNKVNENIEAVYIKGENAGYEQGYKDCYQCLTGDTTVWDGDNFED
ncbi:MAG: hypothetical protein ACQEQD_04565 [Bacillota bacterium]